MKTIDEMLAALLSIQYLKPFKNGRVAIVGNGGGASVLVSDYCREMNLNLADLNDGTAKILIDAGISENGWNLNPVDMPANVLVAEEGKLFSKVIKAFSEDPSVKNILFHINLAPILNYMDVDFVLKKMVGELRAVDRTTTNLAVVLSIIQIL